MKRRFQSQTGLMVGCCLAAIVTPASAEVLPQASGATAQAQGTLPQPDARPQESTPTDDPAGTADPGTQATTTDVVVTGSRIVRDGSQAPTPVTVVAATALQQTAPSNIPDALNKLPVFTASQSQFSVNTNAATAPAMGNYLNLRGLGIQRLLVLLNGSRVTPTTNSNAVDTNVLPQLLVSRVDVVTGGASAAYGSDAITGVVNFVLDDRFKGAKLTAQAGLSDNGDAFSYRYGAAAGFAVGDDIHVIASYEHYKNAGLPSLYDRDWAVNAPIITGAGTAANPFQLTPNGYANDLAYGGVVLSGALAPTINGVVRRMQFRPDGTLTEFVRGLPTRSNNIDQGGDGVIYGRREAAPIAGRLKTDQAFSRITGNLTDAIEVFAQGSFARSETSGNTIPQNHRVNTNRNTQIFVDNPYLRPEVASILTGAGQTSFSIGRFFDDIPLMSQRSVTTYYSGQAGLKGDFGGGWKWDANYVFGRAKLTQSANEFDSRRFFAAVDAVRDPATGRIVCGVTLRNPSLLPGCVPMNVLGEGNITREAFAYARRDSTYSILNRMQYVNANVQGGLFDLPAGTVRLAAGAEYRQQKLDQTTNADPAIFAGAAGAARRAAYFQGIRGVPATALTFLVTNVGVASGTQTVKEGYGELLVPLFRDKPFARNLDLDLAARYTDYRTSGAVTTWKAGINWTPASDVRFRGTYSRDIAAPSLFSLFAGANVTNNGLTDPLTNTVAVIQTSTQGNPDLQPEFAKTGVVGFVLTPRAVPGLTLSVDAYRIRIRGAIQTTNALDQINACNASGGTAAVCSLIVRPISPTNTSPANFPTVVYVVPQNLAALTQKGVDFEISYRRPLDSIFPSIGGDLTLRAFANYLDAYDTQAAVGAAVIHRAGRVLVDQGSGGLPHWKGLLSQTYTLDRLSVTANERFTGSWRRYTTEIFDPVPPRAPNRVYVDLNFAYDILEADRAEVFLNVQNLFDIDPPVYQSLTVTNLSAPTDKTIYDVVGRYFTAGVRVKF